MSKHVSVKLADLQKHPEEFGKILADKVAPLTSADKVGMSPVKADNIPLEKPAEDDPKKTVLSVIESADLVHFLREMKADGRLTPVEGGWRYAEGWSDQKVVESLQEHIPTINEGHVSYRREQLKYHPLVAEPKPKPEPKPGMRGPGRATLLAEAFDGRIGSLEKQVKRLSETGNSEIECYLRDQVEDLKEQNRALAIAIENQRSVQGGVLHRLDVLEKWKTDIVSQLRNGRRF
jgi:hypothetical protein